jgi:hypothetical protein
MGDKEEIGWVEPILVETDADKLREKERRRKSNNDRPSKVRIPSLAVVATQIEFTDDSEAASKLDSDNLQGVKVIPKLATTMARAPRSRASLVDASRKRARGQGLTEGPVLERAMRATVGKDLGTSHPISSFDVF